MVVGLSWPTSGWRRQEVFRLSERCDLFGRGGTLPALVDAHTTLENA